MRRQDGLCWLAALGGPTKEKEVLGTAKPQAGFIIILAAAEF